jgi:post-segregation antitoxin (ccd killing protein)
MEEIKKTGNSLSPLSSFILIAAEKSKSREKTRRKPYCLYLNQDVVEALRDKGFTISLLVDQLLAETLAALEGKSRAEVLFAISPKFREEIAFAAKYRDKWNDPQRRDWWENWFKQTAQEWGITPEELKRLVQG